VTKKKSNQENVVYAIRKKHKQQSQLLGMTLALGAIGWNPPVQQKAVRSVLVQDVVM
jgi:hypothetical protein